MVKTLNLKQNWQFHSEQFNKISCTFNQQLYEYNFALNIFI